MRRSSAFTGFLVAFAFAGSAFAAGRGGFEGGGSQSHSAPPAGSGSFRPSGDGESRRSFSEPSGGGGWAQTPRQPAPVFQRPVFETRRAAPSDPGRASILPSQNGGNRALAPRAALPNPAPLPSQRSAAENDFLGLRPEHTENRQGISNRPNPGIVNRPVQVSFPAGRTPGFAGEHGVLPNPPGRPARPAHPPLPDRWRNASNNFNSQFNHWQQARAAGIASFQGSRGTRWSHIQQRGNDPAWPRQFHAPAYQNWRRDVWNFRKDRAEEVWAATRDLHENLFDDHWWSTAWWRRNPWSIAADVSPWWWWNTATWADTAAFFGSTIAPEPIPYDPGTDVFYDGDSYVVDGQDGGSAADASEQTVALANPPLDEVPVPEPPADGQQQDWLSLGAWALTQQEQGDPVMFFQISVDRDGLVAGGYKNALTGDEQPIVGRLDKKNQRVAWHINNSPQTVFETGLSDLNYDVASVFVHFGSTQTQTWLLVRLPSPATPPSAVNIPR